MPQRGSPERELPVPYWVVTGFQSRVHVRFLSSILCLWLSVTEAPLCLCQLKLPFIPMDREFVDLQESLQVWQVPRGLNLITMIVQMVFPL